MRNFMLLILLTTFCQFLTAHGGPIKGSGQITTQTRKITGYQEIVVNYGVILEIDGSSSTPLTVMIDDNLQSNLITRVENGVLYIDQKEWIEPSSKVVIQVGKTDLRKIVSDAHATTVLSDFTGAMFTVEAKVGSVSVSGKTSELIVNNNVAQVNTLNLIADKVTVVHTGWGNTKINATSSLDILATGSGDIVYQGNPAEFKSQIGKDVSIYPFERAQEKEALLSPIDKVNISLVNNSLRRIQTEVRGPAGQRFGYGIPFNPGQVRKENWPVGTQLLLNDRVIYEVKAGDDAEKQRLFTKE